MNDTKEMWIEWIPNISTGDIEIVRDIADLFTEIPDLYLLHTDRSSEVNRTVFTLVGTPTPLRRALFGLVNLLHNKVDMTLHTGSHPRIGALDVCPYVLLKNGSLNDLYNWVSDIAREISIEYNLPVYLYEKSASQLNRTNLTDIRRGEYEGLKAKLIDPLWKPDYGINFHSGLGATAIGVRDFLIAYNVNLDTNNIGIAKKIASEIRVKGHPDRKHKLPGVKAIGWYLKDTGICQVSTNITKTRQSTPLDVFNHCQELAGEYGCEVTGSELIGLVPYHSVVKMMSDSAYTTTSITGYLGLGYCGIHDLAERIIEHKLYIASGKSLYSEIFDIT